MPYFYIFHSANNDPRKRVRLYHRTAKRAAKGLGMALNIERVDVDGEIDETLKKFFGGATIECVTVINDAKKDSEVNPSKPRIIEMVTGLGSDSQ